MALFLAAGASAWGGLQLGNWLVAHGPAAPVIEERPELSSVPVLDANGLPFVAQPPQPLVNGRLGIPELPDSYPWEVSEASIDELKSNPTIDIATTTITMDEARQIAESMGEGQSLQGIADVGSLGLGAGQAAGQNMPLQPIEVAPPPPPPPPVVTPQAAGGNQWQAALRQELQACSALGFFDRPSCAWAARNKYCEPNNGWGRVRDCPAKSF
ncbi:hypothetical protein [Parapusillimonas granuli]|uniref:hypothetical protein n=1 Tax=Parapusillimonas granuli TaxID=380911 RepID=UPI0017E8F428|nr:hypothetical protein [Parapusillimonas granuli]MEB2399779.1 hypothetical protein [Alcaligenaceae bacterium]